MKMSKPLYWLSRPVADTYTAALLQMDVRQHQDLPSGAKIIAANHPSTTDPFFVAAMLPHQSFILINQLLFKFPLLGKYLQHSGHIPVTAGCGQNAMDQAIQHLNDGHTVIIFPEGELSPEDGSRAKARTGVARLAFATGAPVIPVGINLDAKRLKPVCSNVTGTPEYGRLYLSGPYAMTIGKPLHLNGDIEDRAQVKVSAELVMHHIYELAHESKDRQNRAPGFLRTVLNLF